MGQVVATVIVLAVGFVAFALFVWVKARRQEARAEAQFPPEGQFVDIDGMQIHAVTMGNGPDVVLIHGASGSTRDMTFSLAPALAERYRVIVLDRPGLGYSDALTRDRGGVRHQAKVLAAAARNLGAEKPIVMGQSYGGAVALAWAVHHPDAISALVPVAAASNPWTTPLDPFYRVTSHWLGSRLVIPMITAFVPDSHVKKVVEEVFEPQSAPHGYASHFGPSMTLRRRSLRINAAQRASLKEEITDLHTRYPDITAPTEIVHGTADDTVGLSLHSEKLVHQIPAATLTRLDGIGHMPHHVAQADVIAAIDRAAARAGLR